jgi:hypothetical protein
MSLPFNNMEEAKVWIQNAVMEIFPEWIRGIGNATNTTVEATSNAVTATYNAGRETRRWVDDSLLGMTGRDLGGIFGGVADWILRDSTDLDRLGYSKGGYTGSRGGIVHPHEFVMNNDAVNKWGTNLLSSMNEGRAPLEALISNQALQLGKVPKRMVIQEIDLPAITKRREPSAKLSNAPVASVPSFSSINSLNGDMVKAPIHYGFAEFI